LLEKFQKIIDKQVKKLTIEK